MNAALMSAAGSHNRVNIIHWDVGSDSAMDEPQRIYHLVSPS
jgi:hypothetical protein